MTKEVDPIPKKSNKGLLIGILIVFVILVIAMIVFWTQTSAGGIADIFGVGGTIDTNQFLRKMRDISLQNDDLSIAYSSVTDKHFTNEEIAGRMTFEEGKPYVIETGRVDGWETYLEKTNARDIGPSVVRSRVEIFETVNGAKKAFSREFLWVYNDPERKPDEILDENCKYGDECLLLYYEEITPGATAIKVQWDIVFRYKNVVAWVLVRGSDIETYEQDVHDVAQIVLDNLEAID
jgi:hypothetical protein